MDYSAIDLLGGLDSIYLQHHNRPVRAQCALGDSNLYYLLVRFPIRNGIDEIRGDQMLVRWCFMASVKGQKPIESLPIKNLDHREELKEA